MQCPYHGCQHAGYRLTNFMIRREHIPQLRDVNTHTLKHHKAGDALLPVKMRDCRRFEVHLPGWACKECGWTIELQRAP